MRDLRLTRVSAETRSQPASGRRGSSSTADGNPGRTGRRRCAEASAPATEPQLPLREVRPAPRRPSPQEAEVPIDPQRRDAPEGTPEALLTPAEVAKLFRVDPKTVTRWAQAGKLSSIRTLGGHRRYRHDEVMSLLERSQAARTAS